MNFRSLFFSSFFALGWCGIVLSQELPEREHIRLFSNSYPSYHNATVSKQFPKNHMYQSSATWKNPKNLPAGPSPFAPQDHWKRWSRNTWPPNHSWAISRSWLGKVPGSVNSGPSLDQSHRKFVSLRWYHAPGHYFHISGSWDITPEKHDLTVTRKWPANHRTEISKQNLPIRPKDHITQTSNEYLPKFLGWEDKGHAKSVSKFWPPNHTRMISSTYELGHHRGSSAAWPANHHGGLSKTWPLGAFWIAGHDLTSSKKLGEPKPPNWPVFPRDHSWFTTTADIAGIAGGVEIDLGDPGNPKK